MACVCVCVCVRWATVNTYRKYMCSVANGKRLRTLTLFGEQYQKIWKYLRIDLCDLCKTVEASRKSVWIHNWLGGVAQLWLRWVITEFITDWLIGSGHHFSSDEWPLFNSLLVGQARAGRLSFGEDDWLLNSPNLLLVILFCLGSFILELGASYHVQKTPARCLDSFHTRRTWFR